MNVRYFCQYSPVHTIRFERDLRAVRDQNVTVGGLTAVRDLKQYLKFLANCRSFMVGELILEKIIF